MTRQTLLNISMVDLKTVEISKILLWHQFLTDAFVSYASRITDFAVGNSLPSMKRGRVAHPYRFLSQSSRSFWNNSDVSWSDIYPPRHLHIWTAHRNLLKLFTAG
jgi:hypothetical protein